MIFLAYEICNIAIRSDNYPLKKTLSSNDDR